MDCTTWRLYDVKAKKVIVSRDAVLAERPHAMKEDEDPFILSPTEKVTHPVPTPIAISINQEEKPYDGSPSTSQPVLPPSPSKPLPRWARQLFDESNPGPSISEIPADGPRRSRRIEEQLRAENQVTNMALMIEVMKVKEPATLEDALAQPQWYAAMKSEMNSIQKNDAWDLVPAPTGHKVIGTKWIWKTKYKSDGSLEKCKARLVAQGYSHVEGFDFDDSFAPIAKLSTTIRAMIALAAHKKWKLFQIDVKSAFLNGHLKEEVYVS